jgi:hypothetical protein
MAPVLDQVLRARRAALDHARSRSHDPLAAVA